MKWRWFMRLFGGPTPEHTAQIKKLRRLEERERKAVGRVVAAGVKATIEADKSTEAVEESTARLFNRPNKDPAILTAESMLRFLEERKR